jgi:hypothetical protein
MLVIVLLHKGQSILINTNIILDIIKNMININGGIK